MSAPMWRIVGFGLSLTCVSGCSNPFMSRRGDYAKPIPLERFREIESTTFDQFVDPTPVEIDDPIAAVAEVRERFKDKPEIELSIEEARAAALENNLDLKVALVDPVISDQSITEEEARFESSFNLIARYNNTDSATASSLDEAQGNNQFVEPSFDIPLRTGGSASIALPMSRNETDNEFATLNPSYTSDLRFSLSHSLLRNAGRRANTAALRIAGYNADISQAQTRLTIITQLARIDRTYWQLERAWRELEVSEQQYDLAITQLERARRAVRAGNAAEVDVVRAESGVADRIEQIIIDQNLVLLFERQLKEQMNIPGLGVNSTTAIKPTSRPNPVEYEFDADVLAETAVEQRMEMLELELRLIQDAINIDTAENQLLPLLDLSASYQINGLGESLGDAYDQLVDNRFEDWSVGINAQVPLGNRAAKSRYRRAVLLRMQRLSTREARELSIRREVYDAVDTIQQSWRRILAARQAVLLNARTLEAEQRQFDVGVRTSTDVLDAAAALAVSQSAEARALTDYQIAQIDLAEATGTLLGADRIRWEPVRYDEVDVRGVKEAPPREGD